MSTIAIIFTALVLLAITVEAILLVAHWHDPYERARLLKYQERMFRRMVLEYKLEKYREPLGEVEIKQGPECPNCRTVMQDGAEYRFCPYCGDLLDREEEQ